MSEENKQSTEKELREATIAWESERLRSIYKFELFFSGLVFATVSFAMQFPVRSSWFGLKIAEAFSWVLFLIVGMCALYVCGGFRIRDTHGALRKHDEYLPKIRSCMWVLFVSAIVILAIVKITDLVY